MLVQLSLKCKLDKRKKLSLASVRSSFTFFQMGLRQMQFLGALVSLRGSVRLASRVQGFGFSAPLRGLRVKVWLKGFGVFRLFGGFAYGLEA